DERRALVALDALAREDLNVDHRARDAGWHAQARVLHVGRFFAEDRAQKLFFRRQLRFTLRRHLADQHIAGFDFGANVNDAGVVETAQLRFAEARDVAGDFLGPELRVARHDR